MFYFSSSDEDEGYDSFDDLDPFRIAMRRMLEQELGVFSDSDSEDYSSDEEPTLQKINVRFPDNIYQKIFMYVPSKILKHCIFANKKFKSMFDTEEFYNKRFINEFCKYRREPISNYIPRFKVYVNNAAAIEQRLKQEAPYPDSFTWKKKWIIRTLYDTYYSSKCCACFKRMYGASSRHVPDLKAVFCFDCDKTHVITVQAAVKKNFLLSDEEARLRSVARNGYLWIETLNTFLAEEFTDPKKEIATRAAKFDENNEKFCKSYVAKEIEFKIKLKQLLIKEKIPEEKAHKYAMISAMPSSYVINEDEIKKTVLVDSEAGKRINIYKFKRDCYEYFKSLVPNGVISEKQKAKLRVYIRQNPPSSNSTFNDSDKAIIKRIYTKDTNYKMLKKLVIDMIASLSNQQYKSYKDLPFISRENIRRLLREYKVNDYTLENNLVDEKYGKERREKFVKEVLQYAAKEEVYRKIVKTYGYDYDYCYHPQLKKHVDSKGLTTYQVARELIKEYRSLNNRYGRDYKDVLARVPKTSRNAIVTEALDKITEELKQPFPEKNKSLYSHNTVDNMNSYYGGYSSYSDINIPREDVVDRIFQMIVRNADSYTTNVLKDKLLHKTSVNDHVLTNTQLKREHSSATEEENENVLDDIDEEEEEDPEEQMQNALNQLEPAKKKLRL